jgi:hypothetical protein
METRRDETDGTRRGKEEMENTLRERETERE